ncbi:30S ribosome-binding factor RbfA [Mycoplasmopsis ciconiae]|uniref:Ribosome-binding factor A n=1 Tax=Mycoplasmopsis ciconiae TaxID=561067 RepID=A0ABU7MM71_9BACT|nr:30S ribosome-binding factor RbfA [Mycoplasmopsis ciconiae]
MKRSINLERKEARLQQLISSIVTNDLTNVNIINPVVVDCLLSGDMAHVKVFVVLDGNQEKGLQALNNAAGFIRSVLSKSLDWRTVPQVQFKLDNVSKTGYKIDEILRSIKEENN